MDTVLVTAIGSFSGEAVINALSRCGFRVVGCDIYPADWVANSRLVEKFYRAPLASDVEAYASFVRRTCEGEGARYVVPLTDVEVDAFRECRGRLEAAGIAICMSPNESLDVCRDKGALARFVESSGLGIVTIPTVRLEDADQTSTVFPVVCKPVDGRSSEGLRIVDSWEELSGLLGSPGRERYIVQPFVEGRVVTVDVVRHPASGEACAMARAELLRTQNGAGTSVFVFSDPELESSCRALAAALGVVGCVNFEFIVDGDGRYHLLECNPRFSGGVAFSCMSGYDFVSNHMRCFSGGGIDPMGAVESQFIARRYEEHSMRAVGTGASLREAGLL